MDIISHGLWGSAVFGRKDKKSFWLAFLFGVAPDLFSFGIFFATTFLGITPRPRFSAEPPDPALIPSYVSSLYNLTHSLIIFLLVFGIIIFATRKLRRPPWEMSAWGLHILLDIPTHSYKFFPTPFLWPFSDFKIDGWHWGSGWIFFPNLALLAILYLWFFALKKRFSGT
ncbi:hypothetical protein HY406_01680 [Candidatus Giovannonibacteria bacterium]|nr:hypothetical protein [Candidatus Giovannonibacteria bacterium]